MRVLKNIVPVTSTYINSNSNTLFGLPKEIPSDMDNSSRRSKTRLIHSKSLDKEEKTVSTAQKGARSQQLSSADSGGEEENNEEERETQKQETEEEQGEEHTRKRGRPRGKDKRKKEDEN